MGVPFIPIALGLAEILGPKIGKWIAGDKGEKRAKALVETVGAVTGAETPEDMLARLKASAEAQASVTMKLLETDADLQKVYLADRQDARARDIAIRQAGQNNVRADLMVAGAVVGLIACLACLIFFREDIPGEVVGIVSTIAGIFGACLKDAFSFEFGSSRGSKEKTSILESLGGGSDNRP